MIKGIGDPSILQWLHDYRQQCSTNNPKTIHQHILPLQRIVVDRVFPVFDRQSKDQGTGE